jgi:uncharacterized protein involved in outer membrane biogenesis
VAFWSRTADEGDGARARLARAVTGRAFLIVTLVLVLLAGAYTLAGFFLVPRLITSYATRFVHEQLKRRLSIGEVRVNPLLFKLEIKAFRLQEGDGRPLAAFDRLFIDFELSSLFRRAWTFAEIELDAPRADAIIDKDGKLNFALLLDDLDTGEPPPARPAEPRRVRLQHAVIRNGALSFTDLSGRTPQTATVTPINVEVHDIATLQGQRGPYAIAATLTGGGVVAWEGQVSLVPLASTGHVTLKGFPLSTPWRFVQDNYTLAEPSGRVDAEVRYELAYRDGAATMTVDGVNVTLAGLALTQRGESASMLTLETVRVANARGDLVARQLVVPEVSVSRGKVTAILARDGTVNWQKIVVPTSAPAAAAPPATAPPAGSPPAGGSAAARPWRVALDSVRLDHVAVSITDQSRATPLVVDVGEVTVGFFAKVETTPGGVAAAAEDLGVKLARVAVREAAGGKGDILSLDEILVEGGRFDLAGQHVAATRVAITGGATTVVRAADGSLPLVAMLAPAERGAPTAPADQAARPQPRARSAEVRERPAESRERQTATGPSAASAGASATKPWTVAVASVELAGHRVAFTDQTVSPAVQMEATGIRIAARDLRTTDTKPVAFEAAFDIAKGGRFTAKGQAALDGSSVEATVTLARLVLTPAQPFVSSVAAVTLRSGTFSTTGRATIRAGRDRPVVTYTGSADVDGVNVVESGSGDAVVSWRSLHADRLRFGLAPDRLEIAEVRLTGLDGTLVIYKDKTISVAKLVKPPPAGAPKPSPAPAAPARTAPASTAPAAEPTFPVVVERLRIDDGAANFADLSLVLPFATRVHSLGGVIVGLTSTPGSRTTMKLEGRVDEFGSVKVDGALDAFQPKVFTDIDVNFRNVPMSTLSPYSATFAGRRIVSGTMDVDLDYKIDRSALVGENKVVLRRVQLGERVESPGATRLPLDLAIAILSDSNGVIDLALPVRGNVDAPEFSYGGLIWQAIVTVITKVATAPFRALAGLFRGGGDGEGLESIAFEAGSDRVPPPERQKLAQVAEVLGKRPQLKLTVHGGYAAKVDGEALRSLHVREDLARRLDVKLRPGEDPGPVAFDDPKTQRALEAMLNEREGEKAIEAFEAGYEKTTGKKPERVSRVLALVGRGGGDRAFYEALFRRLVERATLPDAELTALAQRRGEAIARALKEASAGAAARVEVGPTESAESAERNAVPTRLELGAV